jgi:PTS system mannose-specific IIC component
MSVIAGFIFLDSAPLGQFMIAQPVFSAPLLGWIGGDPLAGMIIGVLIQLIWMNRLPIGTYCPPESPVFAMSVVILYLIANRIISVTLFAPMFIVILIYGLLLGVVGGHLTVYIRRKNNHFAYLADQFALKNEVLKIQSLPYLSIFIDWVLYSLLFFLSGLLFLQLLPYLIHYRLNLHFLLYYSWIFMALSIGVVLDGFDFGKRYRLFGIGLLLGLIAGGIRLFWGQ